MVMSLTPMELSDRDEEAASESCNDGDDRWETNSFVREGADEGDEEGRPGLVEGHVHNYNMCSSSHLQWGQDIKYLGKMIKILDPSLRCGGKSMTTAWHNIADKIK